MQIVHLMPKRRRATALQLLVIAASLCALAPVDAAEPAATGIDAPRATEVGAEGAAALVRVLQRFHAAGDGEGGFRWWLSLPFSVRAQQVDEPQVRLWRNKVEFLRDAQRGDPAACAASGSALLKLPMPPADAEVERARLQHCIDGSADAAGGPG